MNKRIIICIVALIAAFIVIKEINAKVLKAPAFKVTSGSPIPVGPMAGDPVIADINNDKNLDIIVACGSCCGSPASPLSGHIQILLNDGRGNFKPAKDSPIKVGPSARKVAVGDANRDGNLDIFVAQHDSFEIPVYLGNGRGSFSPAPGSPFISASGPNVRPRPHTHAITSGDVNNDGNLDILTTNANDNSVSILLGNGKGSFEPSANSPLKAGHHPYDSVLLNDVNLDGKADLITPNLISNAVTVMLGNGKAEFIAAPGSPFKLETRPGYIVVSDFNNDGKPDLAASHDDDPLVVIMIGDGRGGFTTTAESPLRPDNPVWGLSASDINRDGFIDLVMGSQSDHGITILMGNGKGNFTKSQTPTLPAGKRANYVAVADLNRDSRPDIIASSYGSGEITVFLNQTK